MTKPAMSEPNLARTIQRCYEHERAVFDATTRPDTAAPPPVRFHAFGGEDAGNIWVRLVRFCVARSIDPIAYIEWRFEAALTGRPPLPQQLLSPAEADAFLGSLMRESQEIAVAFRVQQQTARTHILLAQRPGGLDPQDAWASVLLDEGLSLSALYRYCLAHSIGGPRFLRIADIYEADAAQQYRRNRTDYDSIWGKWIPQHLLRANT